jgi:ribosomal protein S18 acetylase RimI-like enzyme
MVIEELDSRDQPAATALWQEIGMTRPWNDPATDFDRALRGATSTVLGVRLDDELVGTVMVGHDGHRGWVYYLAVAPAHQAQGLGSKLMTGAEDWLRARGAVKIQLMVRHSNEQVVAFYEHLGYEDAEVTVLSRWLSN